ncbi:MAG: hypothetical protein ACREO1_07490 [Arenimonas sp.]
MTRETFQILFLAGTLSLIACTDSKEPKQELQTGTAKRHLLDSNLDNNKHESAAEIVRYSSKISDMDKKSSLEKTPYEIATANAENEFMLAKRNCQTLPAEQRPDCSNTAEAEYEVTKAAVEALHLSNAETYSY